MAEDEPNTCRECGEEYTEAGDGWDGLCPDCADRADPDQGQDPDATCLQVKS